MAADRVHDVAVVGLGAMGAATLYQLARRGLDAIGIDRHSVPHAYGSSHGETRITRRAVGEGAAFVPLVRRSHEIWRELEHATGGSLFTQCGGLVIGRLASTGVQRGTPGFLRATIAVADGAGIAYELLDMSGIAARFPQFTGLAAEDIGYYEPAAGFVRPEACIRAALAEAARAGALIRTGVAVGEVRQRGDAVVVESDAGPVRAARAVIAAGAWNGGLLGAPFDRLLAVTRQSLYWFAAEDAALYSVERGCPVFIREHGPDDADSFYGFPSIDGATVKLATELYDDPVDPDDHRPGPALASAAAFHADHVAGRLAGVTATLADSAVCLYTSTADGRFLIDAHPAMPLVTVISACSGHGFKHSAAVGELVAERVRSTLLLAPFALPG